jgi:Zn-dependent alcohol dehydrogenase
MGSLPTNVETEAFVVMQPGDDFKLTPIILDEVRDDELLIEMKYSGICHTVCMFLLFH